MKRFLYLSIIQLVAILNPIFDFVFTKTLYSHYISYPLITYNIIVHIIFGLLFFNFFVNKNIFTQKKSKTIIIIYSILNTCSILYFLYQFQSIYYLSMLFILEGLYINYLFCKTDFRNI